MPTPERDDDESLQGFHKIGDGPIFLKTSMPSLFNDVLLNEPAFSQIRLAGQYLKKALAIFKLQKTCYSVKGQKGAIILIWLALPKTE